MRGQIFEFKFLKWQRYTIILFLIWFPLSIAYAKIRVGTVKFDPPYVLSTNQGFEMELINLICQRMNEHCELITMNYYKLTDSLLDGSIDIAIDSIPFYIDAANSPYIYSYPYLLSKGQFVVLKSSKLNFINDLPTGASVGLVKEHGFANNGAFYEFISTKFGSRFKIIPYDDISSLIAAVSNGDITAAFLDNNEACYWEANGNGLFFTLEKPMTVADGIGMMSVPQNKILIDKINQEIQKMEKEGSYVNLYNRYFTIS